MKTKINNSGSGLKPYSILTALMIFPALVVYLWLGRSTLAIGGDSGFCTFTVNRVNINSGCTVWAATLANGGFGVVGNKVCIPCDPNQVQPCPLETWKFQNPLPAGANQMDIINLVMSGFTQNPKGICYVTIQKQADTGCGACHSNTQTASWGSMPSS